MISLVLITVFKLLWKKKQGIKWQNVMIILVAFFFFRVV